MQLVIGFMCGGQTSDKGMIWRGKKLDQMKVFKF